MEHNNTRWSENDLSKIGLFLCVFVSLCRDFASLASSSNRYLCGGRETVVDRSRRDSQEKANMS